MLPLRHFIQGLLCVLFFATVVEGRTIRWFSDPQAINLSGSGTAMDGGFRFELGAFANGFVPSAANTSQWAAHWVPAQRVVYNPANKVFTGQHAVISNAAPFSVNAAAYVWGFGGRAGDQWILFRDTTWLWPETDTTNPVALNWNAKNATQVIVGTIHGTGTPFLMKSAAVQESLPPPTSYPRWREEELAGIALNAPEDDADGDGIENVLEFAFGTDPKMPDQLPGITTAQVEAGGLPHIQLTIPRRMDRVA